MSQDAKQHIWCALNELGDYFSRLGGAGRYYGMPESDIPLFIGCELAQRMEPSFDTAEFVTQELASAAEYVAPRVREHLDRISASSDEMLDLLVDFTVHFEKKLAKRDSSYRWEQFVEWVFQRMERNLL